MSLRFQCVGKTDKGLVRPANEDFLHIDETNAVFAVCDGMGGHQAGEVASMMASDTIMTTFKYFQDQLHEDKNLDIQHALPLKGELLLKSIRLANRAIYNKAAGSSSLYGMGTTIVALALEDDMMSVAHVGDSRAYRLNEKGITPLTVDHSWVAEIQQNQNLSKEEASSVVGKNIITRALGVHDTVEIDYRLIRVKPGDKFILCSDGLCGYADDEEIFNSIRKIRDNNNRMVDNLIQLANDRGGADNVTVIVVEITDIKRTDLPEVERFTLSSETPELLKYEDEWLTKINNFIAHQDESQQIDKPVNKTTLVIIFIAFIIIAMAIIYLFTIR
ncbi:MAG: Stp1/IreP family PP2C-type Ser/Thr phosphatase [FCB group bacterium]|nr:Stp1/IreP family PP2C-type Ser/Thr phosphatase [FCB group bacterium]